MSPYIEEIHFKLDRHKLRPIGTGLFIKIQYIEALLMDDE